MLHIPEKDNTCVVIKHFLLHDVIHWKTALSYDKILVHAKVEAYCFLMNTIWQTILKTMHYCYKTHIP